MVVKYVKEENMKIRSMYCLFGIIPLYIKWDLIQF